MGTEMFEWIISTFLLLLLIYLENRNYEISHRLNFKATIEAKENEKNLESCSNIARTLLSNIIPDHVSRIISQRQNELYSEPHEMAGVFFASITNFLELYEETFESGKEFIRVLNELITDIDELLEKEAYRTKIDKIKTISATFMGASGLQNQREVALDAING